MIEVAKEERIDHFIETYYRATAEVFEFTYGKPTGQKYGETETRDAIQALARIGFTLQIDESAIGKYVELLGKIESLGHKPELEEKIVEMEDVGLLTSQHVNKMARDLSMSDEQFEMSLKLQREARTLLKSKLVQAPERAAKPNKSRVEQEAS